MMGCGYYGLDLKAQFHRIAQTLGHIEIMGSPTRRMTVDALFDQLFAVEIDPIDHVVASLKTGSALIETGPQTEYVGEVLHGHLHGQISPIGRGEGLDASPPVVLDLQEGRTHHGAAISALALPGPVRSRPPPASTVHSVVAAIIDEGLIQDVDEVRLEAVLFRDLYFQDLDGAEGVYLRWFCRKGQPVDGLLAATALGENENALDAGEILEQGPVLPMKEVAQGQQMGQGSLRPGRMDSNPVGGLGEVYDHLGGSLPVVDLRGALGGKLGGHGGNAPKKK